MKPGDEWTTDRLEAVAIFLYEMYLEAGGDDHKKSYDPLLIEGNVAHSYVMDLGDGGRHHRFETLDELARRMKKEFVQNWLPIIVESQDET